MPAKPCPICGSTAQPQYMCPCTDPACTDLVCRSCYGHILCETFYDLTERPPDDAT